MQMPAAVDLAPWAVLDLQANSKLHKRPSSVPVMASAAPEQSFPPTPHNQVSTQQVASVPPDASPACGAKGDSAAHGRPHPSAVAHLEPQPRQGGVAGQRLAQEGAPCGPDQEGSAGLHEIAAPETPSASPLGHLEYRRSPSLSHQLPHTAPETHVDASAPINLPSRHPEHFQAGCCAVPPLGLTDKAGRPGLQRLADTGYAAEAVASPRTRTGQLVRALKSSAATEAGGSLLQPQNLLQRVATIGAAYPAPGHQVALHGLPASPPSEWCAESGGAQRGSNKCMPGLDRPGAHKGGSAAPHSSERSPSAYIRGKLRSGAYDPAPPGVLLAQPASNGTQRLQEWLQRNGSPGRLEGSSPSRVGPRASAPPPLQRPHSWSAAPGTGSWRGSARACDDAQQRVHCEQLRLKVENMQSLLHQTSPSNRLY